jgi:hypothetical protein
MEQSEKIKRNNKEAGKKSLSSKKTLSSNFFDVILDAWNGCLDQAKISIIKS